jgi:serine/threonine protein kinase
MSGSHFALEAVAYQDGRTVARCLLRRGRYVIGQDRKCEIVIPAPSVSGKHARLTVVSEDEFLIEDLGSANGTCVDGALIEAATPLTVASQIKLGEASLAFERGGLPAAVFPHLPAGFLRTARYTVGRSIVQGRTSTIFEAQDTLLRRTVAMKVLQPATQSDAAQVLAFIRDSQITSQLPHAGILPVYDCGLDSEIGFFLTTRFIEGESLADLLTSMASGNPDAPHASLFSLLQIFLKACSAVAFAHARGVVHGALQPEAIIFGRFGEVFVEHWSFARILTTPDGAHPPVQAPDGSATPRLSRYTTPEQADGSDDIDPRTDVHALGAILFRILTLHHFVEGEAPVDILEQILQPPFTPREIFAESEPPAHIPGGQWPELLVEACDRALRPDRAARFADAQEFKKAVGDWLELVVAGGDQTKIWRQFTGLLGRL